MIDGVLKRARHGENMPNPVMTKVTTTTTTMKMAMYLLQRHSEKISMPHQMITTAKITMLFPNLKLLTPKRKGYISYSTI
jgi:hypothetical protein